MNVSKPPFSAVSSSQSIASTARSWRHAVAVEHVDRACAHDDDLAVLDELDPARVGEEGRDRGRDERLVLAAADDERALAARTDQDVGLVQRHRDEGEVAVELPQRGEHRLAEVVAVMVGGDQVRDDLGVGLGREGGALRGEALLDRDVVLDDPVDDDVDLLGGIDQRMRVALADAAVRGPARVADPDRRRGGDRRRRGARAELDERLLEVVEVADRAHRADLAAGQQRDARAVIAAILELAQPAGG